MRRVVAPASANRSPGWLYAGEARASIRAFWTVHIGDLPDAQLGNIDVGGCQRRSALLVNCLTEGTYTYYEDGAVQHCHTRMDVREIRNGLHRVTVTNEWRCHDYSVFQ